MSKNDLEPIDPLVPRQWAQAVVIDSLYCRRCGYDLRGLQADGRCPECGLDIWSSVLSTVDPAASRLPSLRNPPAVGNAIFILMIAMLVGMLLTIAPSVAHVIDSWNSSGLSAWSENVAGLSWPVTALLVAVGLWAVWLLAPPRGSELHGTVWNDIWRIALGYCGWLVFAAIWQQWNGAPARLLEAQRLALHVAAAVFATIGLIGLRGAFDIVGHRSREYRRSQGGRQSLELVIAAIAAGVLGALTRYLGGLDWFAAGWRDSAKAIGQIVLWVGHFMVLIGLAYLVVNAWWIRRSLCRPPPPLDQILMPQVPSEMWIPDRED